MQFNEEERLGSGGSDKNCQHQFDRNADEFTSFSEHQDVFFFALYVLKFPRE